MPSERTLTRMAFSCQSKPSGVSWQTSIIYFAAIFNRLIFSIWNREERSERLWVFPDSRKFPQGCRHTWEVLAAHRQHVVWVWQKFHQLQTIALLNVWGAEPFHRWARRILNATWAQKPPLALRRQHGLRQLDAESRLAGQLGCSWSAKGIRPEGEDAQR